MPALKWTDADEIGFELSEKFPDLDPLEVRFTDMYKMAVELPDFADDPKTSCEGVLEAIQMAWLEYFREN